MEGKGTRPLDRQLVTGVNCQPQTVYSDFLTTKHLCRKTGGALFFHMVQSFPKGGDVDPVTAHAAALELAGFFKGHEVLVCTHIDRAHIHSHFIINSVNLDTGRKLHIAKEQLEELRQRNDQVCLKFGLPVFRQQPCRRKAKSMSTAAYHMADRERSNKVRLMYVIQSCMRRAADRDTFIALMESQGYQVRWEQNRRSITYANPSGWRRRRMEAEEASENFGAVLGAAIGAASLAAEKRRTEQPKPKSPGLPPAQDMLWRQTL